MTGSSSRPRLGHHLFAVFATVALSISGSTVAAFAQTSPQTVLAPDTIVANGAPLRGIAPCGACHGEIGAKAGAAWLEGQPAAYLRAQLGAFASGDRRNDIDEQMRNVARAMTPAEIDAASRYYAAHP